VELFPPYVAAAQKPLVFESQIHWDLTLVAATWTPEGNGTKWSFAADLALKRAAKGIRETGAAVSPVSVARSPLT